MRGATASASSPTWARRTRAQARARAAKANAAWARDLPFAVVTGDDVTEIVRAHPELPLMESGAPVESLLPRMASANAYLGADVVRGALATGARVVMTGRVADPSLFVGTVLHDLGWTYDDYPASPPARWRPSHRMRRAGHRRLFHRSRTQGSAETRRTSAIP